MHIFALLIMQNNLPNIKYTSEELFAQLHVVCDDHVPFDKRYRILRNVFYRTVEQYVASSNINFIGTFAKVDHMVKATGMTPAMMRLIHAARESLFPVNSRKPKPTIEEQRESLPHDIKATALLISYAFDKTSIPTTIKNNFPLGDRISRWGSFEQNCLRVIVNGWDAEYIWATDEQSANVLQICYSNENQNLTRNGKGDWSYLAELLTENCQLNLVRVRMRGEVCHPELIIFEPDYLINVTTIAACFETYAESPLVGLLSKIRPAANSIPIHLGNLAGKYLDDVVHHSEQPFVDGVREFFQKNALSMVTCPEMFVQAKASEFYANAKEQMQNIRKQINSDLPSAVGEYNNSDVVLEPSFYSEVLGIQGRMDFLLDNDSNTVIIEQKSGKGGFVPHRPGTPEPTPVPQTKHLVQILLYRALMVYEFQRYAEQIGHIMLMYSKYPNGLLSTAQIPELMLRAIKMRNMLAWHEMKYATEGMDILTTLTAESLNEKGIQGKLWIQYVKPQIDELLSPIHSASNLERAYYLRFMRFIAKEQMLSKIGNKVKECSGFASVWLDSLEDKRAAGNIYDSLTICKFIYESSAITGIKLRFNTSQTADTSNFRIGDIVILYPYANDAIPSACQQMVHRSTISNITAEGLELKFRNPQTNKHIFNKHINNYWAVEHDMMEASDGALYSAMHSFLSATPDRRAMVLCQRPMRHNTSLKLVGNYGNFNDLVLRSRQAEDIFIVVGPPGTGKTSHGLVNILKEELLTDAANAILICSYTNRAVDEICSKLQEHAIDYIRIGSELSCPDAYKPNLLTNKVKDFGKGTEIRDMLLRQRVICGTTAALNSAISLFSIKHFSLAIIDESSQILEPHLIGLLSARHNDGTDAIQRFVLIGDHKQLPAVVQQTQQESAVTEPELNAIGLTDCRLSFFERMLTHLRGDAISHYMLTRQGRMHQDIAEFPNNEFYGGKLQIVPLAHQDKPLTASPSDSPIVDAITNHRIAFFATPQPEMSASDKINIIEAEIIADTVIEIYNLNKQDFDINQTIGIIVPYRNQIATIRNAIDRRGIPLLHDITIDTVERYQGSQRDYILYGFTIQHTYQLNFLTSTSFVEDGKIIDRKLNVAMTRARLHLILYGNARLLSKIPTYKNLMDFTRQRGAYYVLPLQKH